MNEIITGDALTVLRTLPDCSVQMCVTSPPYFGLRSYIPDGHPDKSLEIGLEETPTAYITKLVEVFREVKRVLRDDGVLWLNIGDSYAGSWGNYAPRGIKGEQRPQTEEGKRWERKAYGNTTFLPPTARAREMGLKPKDLMMIPARVAIALQEDGWYLRSDVIWHKPNAMPGSVTDRPTSAHEHIFLLAKSERYFYDADAIREPGQEWTGLAGTFARSNGKNTLLSIPGQEHVSHRVDRDDRVPSGRNKRNVWTIASQPYAEAHFATFPPKMIEPCILAGSSPKACEVCGAPWERVIEHGPSSWEARKAAGHPMRYGSDGAGQTQKRGTDFDNRAGGTGWVASKTFKGWRPTCTCANEGSGKCIVLDPFMGAGTTALVAIQHKRDYLGIELSPEYVTLIEQRIAHVQQGLWTEVSG